MNAARVFNRCHFHTALAQLPRRYLKFSGLQRIINSPKATALVSRGTSYALSFSLLDGKKTTRSLPYTQIRIMATTNTPTYIVRFFSPSEQAGDAEGRTFNQILNFSDQQLEYHHDYIQYIFPLPERSPVNPWAPVITKGTRDAFISTSELRDQLRKALGRMLSFYGFSLSTATFNGRVDPRQEVPTITKASNFNTAALNTWLKRFDHNHLRVTRIIRSLRVLGLEHEAKMFYRALLDADDQGRVSARTKDFWRRAVERPLHLAPEEEDESAEGLEWLRD